MSNRFTISLAIPCFNAEEHLPSTIESLLNQQVEFEEFIVVDDGSTDRTRTVVEQYPDIRLITHEHNRGIAAARNSAWQAATGEIIIFMDADILAAPHCMTKLLEPYSEDAVVGVGGHGIEAIQETIHDRWRSDILFQHWGDQALDDVPFLFGLCSSYRREVLAEMGGFDSRFRVSGEDMDMGFRIHQNGHRLAYAPEALVYHQRRDHAKSIKGMAYRHCFWGFLAQRKNKTFVNKVSLWHSLSLLLHHMFIDGLAKGSFRYALLSAELHLLIAKAWLDARSHEATGAELLTPAQQAWEGHSSPESNELL